MKIIIWYITWRESNLICQQFQNGTAPFTRGSDIPLVRFKKLWSYAGLSLETATYAVKITKELDKYLYQSCLISFPLLPFFCCSYLKRVSTTILLNPDSHNNYDDDGKCTSLYARLRLSWQSFLQTFTRMQYSYIVKLLCVLHTLRGGAGLLKLLRLRRDKTVNNNSNFSQQYSSITTQSSGKWYTCRYPWGMNCTLPSKWTRRLFKLQGGWGQVANLKCWLKMATFHF